MKKLAWMMAGCLAVNGLIVASTPLFAADPAPADQNQSTMDKMTAGTPTADNPAPDAKDIRKTIGKVATEGVTKGDLKTLVGMFSKDDQDRIEKSDTYDEKYGETLDGRIEQINKAWKDKYGHDFDVDDANKTFNEDFAYIQQGVVGRDNDLAKAVTHEDEGGANAKTNSDLENGRSIAMVTIKAMHGMPDLKVPMIHEMPDSWKVNVPSMVDAKTLRQNLQDHLTMLGEHVADWPADEQMAYRAVAYHVLAAVMNQPMSK